MRLLGYGYGDGLQAVSPGELVVAENRLEYQRGPLVEWYVNDHRGLEQGFTLQEPPPGRGDRGDLHLDLAYAGGLRPTLMDGGSGIEWRDQAGEAVLRYSGLYAYDASGRQLPAHLELPSPWQGEGLGVRVVVDDSTARYPITVDPWLQVAKLAASDGAANNSFGSSVAISGDTVVVGAYGDDSYKGSAYVFVELGTITVVKDVVPHDTSLWDFALAGPTPGTKTNLGDGQSHTFSDLLPGFTI